MKTFVLIWAVGAILTLAFWAGIIYTAIHFIQKYW